MHAFVSAHLAAVGVRPGPPSQTANTCSRSRGPARAEAKPTCFQCLVRRSPLVVAHSRSRTFVARPAACAELQAHEHRGELAHSTPAESSESREFRLNAFGGPAVLLAAAPALLAALSQLDISSTLPLASLGESIQLQLYELERLATQLTSIQLDNLSPLSIAVIFGAGLLTSFSPCTLSMLPICVAYIGGDGENDRLGAFVQSVWFSLGIASTLTALGVAAGSLGLVYGQVGDALPIAVSVLSVVMGLNLLDVLRFNIPSLGDKLGPVPKTLPKSLRSYLTGLSFGVVASPCSTPVLAAILGFVSQSGEPLVGGALLAAYATGFVAPLVVAGTFAGALRQLLQVRAGSGWITSASGAVLLFFGVSSLASRVIPLLS